MEIVGGVIHLGETKNMGMRTLEVGEGIYSKNVFILSKKPSPLASMDMPLSLAYSIRSSFCLAVNFVGIWTLIV